MLRHPIFREKRRSMQSEMAEENAKLSSLFNKKKKKGAKSTTVNANVIAKEQSKAESAAAAASAAKSKAAATTTTTSARPQSPSKTKSKTKPIATSSPAGGPSAVPAKMLSDLSLSDKNAPQEKASFQWAKQPKKYKDTTDKVEYPYASF